MWRRIRHCCSGPRLYGLQAQRTHCGNSLREREREREAKRRLWLSVGRHKAPLTLNSLAFQRLPWFVASVQWWKEIKMCPWGNIFASSFGFTDIKACHFQSLHCVQHRKTCVSIREKAFSPQGKPLYCEYVKTKKDNHAPPSQSRPSLLWKGERKTNRLEAIARCGRNEQCQRRIIAISLCWYKRRKGDARGFTSHEKTIFSWPPAATWSFFFSGRKEGKDRLTLDLSIHLSSLLEMAIRWIHWKRFCVTWGGKREPFK